MKLFISKGLWSYRGYQIKMEQVEGNRTKLIIPNFLGKDENNKEIVKEIEFVLPINVSNLKETWKNRNIFFSKVRKTSNGYTFDVANSTCSRVAYALLNYVGVVPSDIYIPVCMKNNIEVLEKIQFYDVVPDYGDYFTKLYFVKITVPQNISIPFYLSWRDNPGCLKDHLIFYKEKYSGINVRECQTYICLDSLWKHDYISLSDL